MKNKMGAESRLKMGPIIDSKNCGYFLQGGLLVVPGPVSPLTVQMTRPGGPRKHTLSRSMNHPLRTPEKNPLFVALHSPSWLASLTPQGWSQGFRITQGKCPF